MHLVSVIFDQRTIVAPPGGQVNIISMGIPLGNNDVSHLNSFFQTILSFLNCACSVTIIIRNLGNNNRENESELAKFKDMLETMLNQISAVGNVSITRSEVDRTYYLKIPKIIS